MSTSKVCTYTSMAASTWRQPRCPSADPWLAHLQSTHTMESSWTWKGVERREEPPRRPDAEAMMDTISFKKKTTQIFKIFIDHNHGGRWPLQPLANLKLWGMDPRPPHQACGLQTPLVPAQVKSHHCVLSSGVTESVSRSAVSDSLRSMDCSPPGSSVHGILQARILEWVAVPFSRGSSQRRDQMWVSCIAGRFFII